MKEAQKESKKFSYIDATLAEVDAAMQKAAQAFLQYRQLNLQQRAVFLNTIAQELEKERSTLLQTAAEETHLTIDRLSTELDRTLFQLTNYAEACAEGTWLDIRIDTADEQLKPPRPEMRKMLVPLGPVVVFGASNFPFAYSTAGGDSACALAAGCPVVIKAHPAHAATSQGVAEAVHRAAKTCSIPEDVFVHLHGATFEVGAALVKHPLTKAVGFTGSFEGGKSLFDMANNRPVPIPVFAEMGSVNPVFLLPQKLQAEAITIAKLYAQSITVSVGQFCTNPGILVGIEGDSLNIFKKALGVAIAATAPQKMLHNGIAKHFQEKRTTVLAQKGVNVIAAAEPVEDSLKSQPTLAETTAKSFLSNPLLHKEVFGPFSLLVTCANASEMLQVARSMEGQLTTSLMATEEEAKEQSDLIQVIGERCGRMVYNSVPTGVAVALSMHHGGPYPATTDARFTAVGADGIKRFARPLCFQNWPDALLPLELKNSNPLDLWRTVNNMLTKNEIG